MKKRLLGLCVVQWLALVAYGIAIIINSSMLSNGIAILPLILGIGLIFSSNKQSHLYFRSKLLIGFALMFWFFGESHWWLLENFMNMDPESSLISSLLYLITNVFLMAAALSYFFSNIKKWHRYQLMADASAITMIVALIFVNILLIREGYFKTDFWDALIRLFYIVLNGVTLSVILITVSATRKQTLTSHAKLLLAGLLIFIGTDTYYIYLSLSDRYIPNSWIDLLYLTSFVLMATGIMVMGLQATSIKTQTTASPPNKLDKFNYLFISLFILSVLLTLTGLVAPLHFIHILIVLTVHHIISGYIQITMNHELLLWKERMMTAHLEDLVKERTKALTNANEALSDIAITDALTGLYNRRYFYDCIDEHIDQSKSPFSVLYLDLDHFKIINDVHGHDMGDALLKDLADRLCTIDSPNHVIARIGGDEFGILCFSHENDLSNANLSFYQSLLDLIEAPFILDPFVFNISASMGIAHYPSDADSREQLMKYADLAMFYAKGHPTEHKWVLYRNTFSEKIERKSAIEVALRSAHYDTAFDLHFQPQFALPSRELIGVEALLRWHDPLLGNISPMDFIPIAEETGLIVPIGDWVLKEGFKQLAKWNQNFNPPIKMGINLSPLQFDSLHFLPSIKQALHEYGITPSWVDFEITENSAMNSSTYMEEVFTDFAGLGVQISVDDFGTGYSSLNYIQRFDIDHLKIAKELIDDITFDANKTLIIKAIIMMAKGMGIKTIAEGVETKDQLDLLIDLSCDAVQGYYLSKPITREAFEALYLKP